MVTMSDGTCNDEVHARAAHLRHRVGTSALAVGLPACAEGGMHDMISSVSLCPEGRADEAV
jgi:hypothetical protein